MGERCQACKKEGVGSLGPPRNGTLSSLLSFRPPVPPPPKRYGVVEVVEDIFFFFHYDEVPNFSLRPPLEAAEQHGGPWWNILGTFLEHPWNL